MHPLLRYAACFMLYSVAGWIMETIWVSAQQKHLVKRGFLYGCYCPIYGVGMCALIALLTPFQNNIPLLYCAAVLVATAIEFVTSWGMEKLFHARWWDYSNLKFNLQGRVCLQISLTWGVLATGMILLVQPRIDAWLTSLPQDALRCAVWIVGGLFAVDCVLSFISAFHLTSKLAALYRLREEAYAVWKQLGRTGTIRELRERFADFLLGENGEFKHRGSNASEGADSAAFARVRQALEGLAERYKGVLARFNLGEKRFLRAYPRFRFMQEKDLAEDLRKLFRRMREKTKDHHSGGSAS